MSDRLVGLEIEERGDVVIARVTGELDIAEAAATGERVAAAVPSDARGLVMDFSRLEFIDSSGIAMLFQLVRQVAARRQVLHVVAEPEGPVQAHRAQLANLLSHWRNGEQPELSIVEARSTLEFLTALYKSSAEGTSVRRGEIAEGDPFYSALDAAGPARAAARNA